MSACCMRKRRRLPTQSQHMLQLHASTYPQMFTYVPLLRLLLLRFSGYAERDCVCVCVYVSSLSFFENAPCGSAFLQTETYTRCLNLMRAQYVDSSSSSSCSVFLSFLTRAGLGNVCVRLTGSKVSAFIELKRTSFSRRRRMCTRPRAYTSHICVFIACDKPTREDGLPLRDAYVSTVSAAELVVVAQCERCVVRQRRAALDSDPLQHEMISC